MNKANRLEQTSLERLIALYKAGAMPSIIISTVNDFGFPYPWINRKIGPLFRLVPNMQYDPIYHIVYISYEDWMTFVALSGIPSSDPQKAKDNNLKPAPYL